MKYSDNNPPVKCMMTGSRCYRGTVAMAVKGILWHDTGSDNPTVKRYVQPDDDAPDREKMIEILGKNPNGNDWNHSDREAGVNAFIGKLADGTVSAVQVMPWNFRPWGCGNGKKGSCNDGWIQFEICEDGRDDAEYFKKAYDEACELTAYLCKMYGIDPNGEVDYNGVKVPTILCHADSYKLGVGNNHDDVDDWFPRFGKSMATARADVAALLGADAPASAGETVYVTKEGDTLWGIAKTYLGSGARYTEIMALNGMKSDVISAGMKLKLPADAKGVDTTPAAPELRTYTTKDGDTLWGIAKSQLGSGARYTEIIALNGMKSDVIRGGMKLLLPNQK